MRGLTSGNIEFYTIPTKGNAVIGGADVIRVDIAEVRAAAIDNLVTDALQRPHPGAPPAPRHRPASRHCPARTRSRLGDETGLALVKQAPRGDD
jgi:hypothetical protein